MSDHESNSRFSRRRLLSSAAGSVIVVASGSAVQSKAIGDLPADLESRREMSKRVRDTANYTATSKYYPVHGTNGDEENLTPKYIGNFYKGLPQSPNGVVVEDAYDSLIAALASGDPDDFEKIPLGKVPQVNSAAFSTLTDFKLATAEPISDMVDIVSSQVFYREASEFSKGIPVQAATFTAFTSRPKPRFYRLHSERAVTPDGKSALINPQAALGFDLEALDSHGFRIAPPPSYSSDEIVAEIAENYWMALTRDVPFIAIEDPSKDTTGYVQAAIDDLNKYDPSVLKVPRDLKSGKITSKTLFRGTATGDIGGPYVSQFLLRAVPFGAYFVDQIVKVGYKEITGTDGKKHSPVFLNNKEDWYNSQLGLILPLVESDPSSGKYSYRPRELCDYVHIDELFQGYLNAELIMSAGAPRGLGVPLNKGNPYSVSKTQTGFGTLGQPNFASLIAEVATRALKTVWYQKWSVHRRLRPEAFAGHLHFKMSGGTIDYPIASSARDRLKDVLKATKEFNAIRNGDGYFLPMAFRDGCPSHPAYGAGHATVAGACITLLKAFYDEDAKIATLGEPVSGKTYVGKIFVAAEQGKLIETSEEFPTGVNHDSPYNFNDFKDSMTVGGELNKLASNVSLARNFAGVHWRSDHAASLPLGERVAVQFLKEIVETYNEDISFNFTSFSGQKIGISKIA